MAVGSSVYSCTFFKKVINYGSFYAPENCQRDFLYKRQCPVFVAASHQTRLDTRSKARRPIKVGIKGRGRSGTSRDSNPACLCCSSAHLVQCEPDEASSFTNPNVGPGTYASLRLKLDAWSSAVQKGQKCSSPTRRLPSRSWGPIRPRVCSWFRAPIRHECQTAQPKRRGSAVNFFFTVKSVVFLC